MREAQIGVEGETSQNSDSSGHVKLRKKEALSKATAKWEKQKNE